METPDFEKLIAELEIAVDRLRSLYEQYFMGIERIEPAVARKDVDRRVYVLRKEQIRNTALRFRFQMLLQRYNTYQTHWQRICRDIENGTYKRHLLRAQQRFGPGKRPSTRPPPPPVAEKSLADELAELDREFAPAAPILPQAEVNLDDEPTMARGRAPVAVAPPSPPSTRTIPHPPRETPLPRSVAARPSAPRAPGSQRTPVPKPAPPSSREAPPSNRSLPQGQKTPAAPAAVKRPNPDLPDERVRQLYGQYIEAKRRQNESTAAITFDAVAKSLRESSAKLRTRHGKSVDFEVAIKDGRAILRPVLK